ncbi:Gag-pol fusion protein [Phytophthora cinnamomi]|uniref:Gag-pol fusion protein n=1 Tax=Phytophthora cinnamomi TaxID=4785 RepID=UPI003559F17C|nr:Gag-pol fusion protein [Phytophthora cinnamomi]
MRTQAVHNVEVAVPAKDGAMGLFMPRVRKQSHLLLALTLVTVRDGKAVVPVLNLVGRTPKLPSKGKLGTWVPTDREMDILELDGELDRERVSAWLESLRTTTAPLSNEDELNIGEMEDKDKELIFTLLRNFPSLLELTTGCPPATTLGVVHHINTGSEPPVKVLPRRHSRSEHETIDAEVKGMFHDGVIEEGTGAWGFPVVLVRKKDGTVRKSFKLVTDASEVGLGAALMQDHGNGDQPVAFMSKVNSPTVSKYGITDLECAAVVWVVRLLTDEEVRQLQRENKLVKRLKDDGAYNGQEVAVENDLVYLRGKDGALRLVLPVPLRAKALREAHDSIYAGHLRTP